MSDTTAVYVLGGAIVKKEGVWRTADYSDKGDAHGIDGSMKRVLAAGCLYKERSDLLIIASGGKGQNREIPDAPCVADVIARELIAAGVKKEHILTETISGNTWQQLQELKHFMQDKGIQKITVISNRYHLPRVEAMIERDEVLRGLKHNGRLRTRDAESIVLESVPELRADIEAAYQSEAMKKRVEKEEQGIRQLQEGTYTSL